jgi:hypothetical protein
VRDSGYRVYREAVVELGRPDPGPLSASGPFFTWVAKDPDQAWNDIGPCCLHESNQYAALARAAGVDTGFRAYDDVNDLRAGGQYPILTPDEFISLCFDLGDDGRLAIAPLVGGVSPEASWRCLELIEHEVLPHVRSMPSPPDSYRMSPPPLTRPA